MLIFYTGTVSSAHKPVYHIYSSGSVYLDIYRCRIEADTYNAKKTKYWVEKKVSATMTARQRHREVDSTSYQTDVKTVDNGAAISLGERCSFNMGALGMLGSSAPASTSNGD